MKNLLTTLIFLLILKISTAYAQVQISIPEAPNKIELANVLIDLSPEAKEMVNKEITKLLTPQNRFLEDKLERLQWYFPIIERILEEENVPQDFKYLAVLESSMLPDAFSSSNAVGFWQFKDATAKEMGLRVDNSIDDRKNIYESTKAAALYMKRNNLIYKNWVSCMLTYKEGATGAASNIPVEWSFASEIKFDKNTHPYLITALAHRIAFEHRLNRIKDSPRKFIEYPTKGKSFGEIAVELSVDITELRTHNAWLYAPAVPSDKTYTLLVLSRIADFEEINSKIQKRANVRTLDVGFPQLKRITMVSTSPEAPIYYEINGRKGILAQPGNEVAQMAAKSNTKISRFLSYNDMSDRDMVKEGQVYYLQSKVKKAKVPFHTVLGEQSLWDISQMYGVRLKSILKYNRMKSAKELQPGRVLWLQKTRPKSQAIEIIQEAIKPINTTPDTPPIVVENSKLPVRENYSPPTEVVKTTPSPAPTRKVEPAPTPVYKEPTKEVVVAKKETVKPVVREDVLKADDPIFGSTKTTPSRNEPSNSSTSKVVKTHTVKQGETLYSISKKYNLTVNELRSLNNLSPTEAILYNQSLIVSAGQPSNILQKETATKIEKAPPLYEKESVKKAYENKTHKVNAGETLFSISNQYGIEVSEIKFWNDLSDNTISIGQELIVSKNNTAKAKTTEKPLSSSSSHIVASGETLYSISRKHNVAVNELKAWNNLRDNSISVGQKLIIKK